MNVKKIIKTYLQRLIHDEIEKVVDEKVSISLQIKEYRNASDKFLASKVESTTDITNIRNRFVSQGVTVRDIIIDIDDFIKWQNEYSEMEMFYQGFGDVYIEKLLEHYITMKYLNISNKDTLIDVAASTSPFAEAVAKHLGNTCYKQDLILPHGIHGNSIGGDAAKMPVSDGFCDVITLHCAYECFQGNSDIGLIKEVPRILRAGGRIGIVPLYTDDVYFVKTGPLCDKSKISVEDEARWIWRDDAYLKEPFSRHYSPEAFKTRILDQTDMKYEILYFTNLDDIMRKFSGQRVYCHFMFKAIKA